MTSHENAQSRPTLFGRFIGLILFVIFLGLGLIGLVLPIIPGLLFLLLALLMLSRVSRRFAFLVNRNSALRRALRRLRHAKTLAPVDLLRLSFWVTARGLLNGSAALARGVGALVSRVPQTQMQRMRK